MEEKTINKKILTIEDIIKKKEECKKRKETKHCYIESKFLGGNLLAHSLTKGDMRDIFYGDLRHDKEKQMRQFIYRSIDCLQEPDLLNAFGRKGKKCDMIVEDLWENYEVNKIGDVLLALNGLTTLSENEIMSHEVEELKGE